MSATTERNVDKLRALTAPSAWPFSVIAGVGSWLTTTGFFVSNNLDPADTANRLIVFVVIWSAGLTLILQGVATLLATTPPRSQAAAQIGEQLLELIIPLRLIGSMYVATLPDNYTRLEQKTGRNR